MVQDANETARTRVTAGGDGHTVALFGSQRTWPHSYNCVQSQCISARSGLPSLRSYVILARYEIIQPFGRCAVRNSSTLLLEFLSLLHQSSLTTRWGKIESRFVLAPPCAILVQSVLTIRSGPIRGILYVGGSVIRNFQGGSRISGPRSKSLYGELPRKNLNPENVDSSAARREFINEIP